MHTEGIEKTPPAERETLELVGSLEPAGKEAINRRVAILRGIAGQARENETARRTLAQLLDIVSGSLPEEADSFRAYYLNGEKRSARSVSHSLCLDMTTLHRHNRRIFEAMLSPFFGVYGIFLTEREHEGMREPGKVEG